MNLLTLAFVVAALLPGNHYTQLWPSIVALSHQVDPVAAPLAAPVLPPQPTKGGNQPLNLSAKAVFAIDRASGRILYAKNADAQLPIASITKLATVITVMHSHSLDQLVTIPNLPIYKPEDELVGLAAGERWKIRDLITAALVASGNDAADALALIDSGSKEAFASNMNARMKDWGIANVNFNNPSGLTDTGNGASVQAVAQMGLLSLHNAEIAKIIDTKSTTIINQAGRAITLETTNQLLQKGNFSGIKTGYTLAAGECFVGLADVSGHQVVTVVLGSPDRFGETNQLAAWINRNYKWQ